MYFAENLYRLLSDICSSRRGCRTRSMCEELFSYFDFTSRIWFV